MIKNKHFWLAIIFLSPLGVLGGYAQARNSSRVPTNCGVSQRILDSVNAVTKDDSLIIISRLGSTEKNRNIARLRVESAFDYLAKAWGRSRERTILGVGDRAVGEGRLDIYVRGQLVYTLWAARNRNILTFCKNQE